MGIIEDLKKNYAGRERPAERPKTISVSALVKNSAQEVVRRMRTPDDQPRTTPQMLGYATEEYALRGLDREVEVRIPLDDGWTLMGHADAVAEEGKQVWIVEHKAHRDPSAGKVEMARRQAVLYLAMMEASREAREGVFPCEGGAWGWPAGGSLGGVVLCIVNTLSDELPAPLQEPYTREQLAAHLLFYKNKAQHIIAELEGEAGAASGWDLGPGLTEFDRPMSEMGDAALGDEALKDLLARGMALQEEVKRKGQALEAVKAEAERAMRERGLSTLVLDGVSAVLQSRQNADRADVNALKAAGLMSYVLPGTRSDFIVLRRRRE